jgi:hypothetical protein
MEMDKPHFFVISRWKRFLKCKGQGPFKFSKKCPAAKHYTDIYRLVLLLTHLSFRWTVSFSFQILTICSSSNSSPLLAELLLMLRLLPIELLPRPPVLLLWLLLLLAMLLLPVLELQKPLAWLLLAELLMLLRMLVLSLLLGEDESWLRRDVSFSPRRPPSCVFAILTYVHWMGICCHARLSMEDFSGEVKVLFITACFKNQSEPWRL